MKTKILILVSILMLVTTMIGAQEKKMALGLTTQILLQPTEDTLAATKTTDDYLLFKPQFAFMLSEKTELDIFLYLRSDVIKVNNVISGLNENTTIGAGVGILQHLLVGNIFDFSTGFEALLTTVLNPQYFSYSEFDVSVSLPVVLDIKFTDTIRFRIKHSVVTLALNTTSTQLTNVSTVNKSTTLNILSYNTGPTIELGFMFWF